MGSPSLGNGLVGVVFFWAVPAFFLCVVWYVVSLNSGSFCILVMALLADVGYVELLHGGKHNKMNGSRYRRWWLAKWNTKYEVMIPLGRGSMLILPDELAGRRVRLRLEVLPESCPGSSEERLLEEEEEWQE